MGQNAFERIQQIVKQLLDEGFKYETFQKILIVKQELFKFNSAFQ